MNQPIRIGDVKINTKLTFAKLAVLAPESDCNRVGSDLMLSVRHVCLSGGGGVKRCDTLTCHFLLCWFSWFLWVLLRNAHRIHLFYFHRRFVSVYKKIKTVKHKVLSKLRPGFPNRVQTA